MLKLERGVNMIEKIIYNNENGIFNFIKDILNEGNKKKHVVLSQIDDQTMEKIDEWLSEKIESLYICIDRYLTTKKIFQNLLQSDKYINKYVFCNSEMQGNRLNNLIMLESETQLEILIIPFCLTDFNLTASNSFAIYLSCNINEENSLKELFDLYLKKLEYNKLTEEYVNECELKKLFRNDKANTLYKDVNKDEVIQSFRNITESDNVDETLRVIQSQSSAKKFSLDRSEMSFNITSDENQTSNNFTFDNDIEIDIQI